MADGYPRCLAGVCRRLTAATGAADPLHLPAGSNDYRAGLDFDRTGTAKKTRIFVARFIDTNNKEAGDPILYLGANALASNTGESGDFLDKRWVSPASGAVPTAATRWCVRQAST